MKKLLLTTMCIAALAACEKKDKPLAELKLQCEEFGLSVKVYKDRVDADIGGEVISLPRVESVSGAMFWVEAIGLWNKGENWSLVVGSGDQEMLIGCTTINQ